MDSGFDREIGRLEIIDTLVDADAIKIFSDFKWFHLENRHFLLDSHYFTCIFLHKA
jgi:hypothetical protein